jgi:hypothetical protein
MENGLAVKILRELFELFIFIKYIISYVKKIYIVLSLVSEVNLFNVMSIQKYSLIKKTNVLTVKDCVKNGFGVDLVKL